MQPHVSICIPVYNCERYIGEAIESVLSQSYKNYELVILNNCSTDGTASVIGRYHDARMRVIENQTNIGAAGNWNKALSEARGSFIKILCADDFLYPTCIEQQLAALEHPGNKGVVLVSCGRNIIDEHGKRYLTRSYREGRMSGVTAIRKTVRYGANIFGEPSAVLFSAKTLSDRERFDEHMNYAIDLDFWCQMLQTGDAYIIHEPLCAFRVSASSWSSTVARSQAADFRKLILKLIKSKQIGISLIDRLLGNSRASLNMLLRRLFYQVLNFTGNSLAARAGDNANTV